MEDDESEINQESEEDDTLSDGENQNEIEGEEEELSENDSFQDIN